MIIKAKKLNGFLSPMIGLMFGINSPPVYFETRWGIHTWFLKYPIDVLIIDERSKVVFLKKELKPYSLYFWNPKFFRVLELQSGSIAHKNIKKGASLTFKDS